MVYIGHFNSGAAKITIPVLNQAGLVMISPANTYPGLTKPGKGEPNEPGVYYPTGVRNYTRVVPADDLQGAVGAAFVRRTLNARLGLRGGRHQLYGKGIADVFAATAQRLGVRLAGRDGIDGKASDYKALATKIRAARPEAIYYGGITQNNAGKLLKDIREAGITVPFVGPDGIQERAFIDDAGEDAEGVYATFGGLPTTAYRGPPWSGPTATGSSTPTPTPSRTPSTATRRPGWPWRRSSGRGSRTARPSAPPSSAPGTSRASWAPGASTRTGTSLTTMSVSRIGRTGDRHGFILQEVLTAPE